MDFNDGRAILLDLSFSLKKFGDIILIIFIFLNFIEFLVLPIFNIDNAIIIIPLNVI